MSKPPLLVIQNTEDWLKWYQHNQASLGLVATLGNIHAGHLSLVHKAKQHARRVVVSIYVNPTQFAANEDFDDYPRTPQQDLLKLDQVGVDAVLMPSDEMIYPQGITAAKAFDLHQYPELYQQSQRLCGQSRKHFFSAVIQVIGRLFELIKPTLAVFGEKDYQQLQIIRQYAQYRFADIQVLAAETVREENGLAMSSRNQYLDQQHYQQASQLYRTLQQTRDQLLLEPNRVQSILLMAIEQLQAAGFEMDYLALADSFTLLPVNRLSGADLGTAKLATLRLFVAAYLQTKTTRVRLIDNLALSTPPSEVGQ